MRILITNDDGIHAIGLQTLERIAQSLSDEVWVIAPEMDQSGVSHSLTLSDPLRLREVSERHYALKGTPTDCVIMGVKYLMRDEPPDLVISGVNRGQNLADDVTYSGTVAGAIEGTLLGIRSIALSQAYGFGSRDSCRYETAEAHAADLIRKLIKSSWPAHTLMNVNFPDRAPDDVRGMLLTKQGKRMPDLLHIDKRRDGRGFPYYWIAFKPREHELVEGTDLKAVTEGYISVTPLQLDLTDHPALTRLQAELKNGS
jgi:5'-nucleotidase